MQLGIVGGVSWASTRDYYERYSEAMGGLHSPELVISSLNLQTYADFAYAGNFDGMGSYVSEHGVDKCVNAGANLIIIASNTAHVAFPLCEAKGQNVLHIADCIATRAKIDHSITQLAFLGTIFTMEKAELITNRLRQHKLTVVVPSSAETRKNIQIIIEEELSHNIVTERGKACFLKTIQDLLLEQPNIQGIILGCTEIGLAITRTFLDEHELSHLVMIDSAACHVDSVMNILLNKKELAFYLPEA